MSRQCPIPPGSQPQRWVGDPVDVVTGNHVDVALEFRLPWSFPFVWRLYYSAARSAEALPLGWGRTHEYDHRLTYAVDGFLYSDPVGRAYTFWLAPDTDVATRHGALIHRVGAHRFRVKAPGFPQCEFEYEDVTRPAQLRRILRGRAAQVIQHTPEGRVSAVGYSRGTTVHFDYDTSGRIVAAYFWASGGRRDQVAWRAQYDRQGNLIRIVDPYGASQMFAYDSQNRMIARSDRRGYRFSYDYDEEGRCVRSTTEDGVQGVRLRYLPEQGLTVLTRADGGEWQYFHADGQVTRCIDPYGGSRAWSYAPDGSLESEIGPEGEIVRIAETLDEHGAKLLRRPMRPVSSMGVLIGDPWFEFIRGSSLPYDAMGWDGHGDRVCRNAIRLPFGDSSRFARLPRNVTRALRFAANSQEGQLPRTGHLHKAVRVPERPGSFEHDRLDTLVSHRDPAGNTARWRYDANGNVVQATDHAGSVWRYTYTSWNLLVKEIDPNGTETTYGYTSTEARSRTRDGGGTQTDEIHDVKDRLIERRRHRVLVDSFAYDLSDAIVRVGEPGAERILVELGPARRPVLYAAAGQKPRNLAYDANHRLVSVEEEEGDSLAFEYDEAGNRTADLRNGAGVHRVYGASRLRRIIVRETFVIGYDYDATTATTTISDPLGHKHAVEVLHSGLFVRRLANGSAEVCQYDWNGQCLRRIRFGSGRSLALWSRAYSYSPVGALVRSEDSSTGDAHYEYDAAHRLSRAQGSRGEAYAYEYDAAGNLITAPGLHGPRYDENRLTAAGDRSFRYNERHHLVEESGPGGKDIYEYDSEDRLRSCRIAGRRVDFEYDALGRRSAKESDSGVTWFLWDGDRLAAETAPGERFRLYLYTDGQGLTPFAFIDYPDEGAHPQSGVPYHIFSDQVGCPVRVEDAAGAIVWRATIEPYGRAHIHADSSVELNLRWPGHYFDAETGLHYNRHRYYSPRLHRYIQVDPRDLGGGINVYAYPARPLDQVDVDGLAPCPKKPILRPDEDDAEFQRARQEADQVADQMRQAINDAEANGEVWPGSTTLAAIVVRDRNGNYEVVVTGNRNPGGLPPAVIDSMGGRRVAGWGPDQTDGPYPGGSNDRPPPVRVDENDPGWNHPRTNPNGDRELTTHNHAEQRGLRSVDCDDDLEGVAHVAPTRPCCEGCSSAIQTPEDQGGWGGDGENVSDLGRQPGAHGDWW